jgi:hypothetical protein
MYPLKFVRVAAGLRLCQREPPRLQHLQGQPMEVQPMGIPVFRHVAGLAPFSSINVQMCPVQLGCFAPAVRYCTAIRKRVRSCQTVSFKHVGGAR